MRPPETRPPSTGTLRRVVTGVNGAGKSVILTDGPCESAVTLHGIPGFRLTEIWKTTQTPADTSVQSDQCAGAVLLEPSRGGTTLRMVEFPPDSEWRGSVAAADAFSALGQAARESIDEHSTRHPMMHQTRTLDYIVVVKGEIWAVMEEGETCLRAGDVLVQRGTNHAWSVRTKEPCCVIAVLIDATSRQPATD